MSNYYCYMRISTKEERGKQGYSRQEKALEKYAKQHNIEYVLAIKEDESGKSFENRKKWKSLELIVQPGDSIVFKDICRFTRECENGFDKYMELMDKGVNLIFLDNYIISTDYIKSLMDVAEKQENRIAKKSLKDTIELLIMVELDRAEQERVILSKRTADGMRARRIAAEEQGLEWRCGRRPGKLDKLSDELSEDIKKYCSDRTIKQSTLMKKHNISRNTLKKYIDIVQGTFS